MGPRAGSLPLTKIQILHFKNPWRGSERRESELAASQASMRSGQLMSLPSWERMPVMILHARIHTHLFFLPGPTPDIKGAFPFQEGKYEAQNGKGKESWLVKRIPANTQHNH